MAKRPPQPTGPELYCQMNGLLLIRSPRAGQKTTDSIPLHTSNIDTAREAFAKWLAKNRIANINAKIAPINSIFGVLSGDGSTVSMIKRARDAAAATVAPAPTPQVPAVYDEALARATRQREKKREYQRERYKRIKAGNGSAAPAAGQSAHGLLAALAANLASAATILNLLQEELGAPKTSVS